MRGRTNTMSRPYVHLQTENKLNQLLAELNESLHIFKSLDGIQGILLDGGLSRGYADELSEIDILIFLEKEMYQYYQQGNCPFALGITVIDGALYDIKLADYEEEYKKEYDQVALWDLSYASILYDPNQKMSDLIERKLSEPIHIGGGYGFLWEAYWTYKLAGDIWIHRQDVLQGHMMFSSAIKPLLSALFIANKEYVPHDKWLVHMSRTLEWKPDRYEELLQGAMSTGDFTVQSLVERQKCIDTLWCAINQKFCEMEQYTGSLNIIQKGSYDALLNMLSKEEYTVEEWQKEHNLEELNAEPVHTLFRRKGEKILLDKKCFLNLKPQDMYSWMYEIVDDARTNR